MKYKWRKIAVLALGMVFMASGTSYARNQDEYLKIVNTSIESELLPEGIRQSEGSLQGVERSTALAGALSSITNEGNGVIGILAETTMYTPVDWACLTVYLEKWYEDAESWQTVKTFEKEFLPEDEEDGLLTVATFSADVTDQPTGYYYRVRTIHELEFDNGWYEAKVTKTDGILITSAP